MTTYQGWWQVPPHLLPATALGELEYPRAPAGDPVAWVEVRENWAGKNDEIALYDARACPPTTATARQLVAAAYRSARQRQRQRTCADCHARCQRPLPPLDEHDPRPLCPACRHVALLRRRQAELATSRQACAERARELLASPHTAVLQVDLTVPPPTPAGRTRPPTAAHVRAVDPDGTRLVDLVVRLVGPRAHHIPDGAVAAEDAAPAVHGALLGRRLLMWSDHDLAGLRMAARHKDLPGVVGMAWAWAGCSLKEPTRARAVALQHLAAQWRGQLGPAHPGASRLPATGHAWARERGSGHAHRSDPSLGGTCGGGSMSQGERETGRRVLRELAALLTASGVQAVYHQPPQRRPGYGWIAVNPARRRGGDDAVWYVGAGAQLNGRRLDRPHLVWGHHFEQQAPTGDLQAVTERIAAQALARPARRAAAGRRGREGRPAARARGKAR